MIRLLHDDLISVVLSFAPLSDLLRCAQVCKKWRTLVNSDVIWKPLVKRFTDRVKVSLIEAELARERAYKEVYLRYVPLFFYDDDQLMSDALALCNCVVVGSFLDAGNRGRENPTLEVSSVLVRPNMKFDDYNPKCAFIEDKIEFELEVLHDKKCLITNLPIVESKGWSSRSMSNTENYGVWILLVTDENECFILNPYGVPLSEAEWTRSIYPRFKSVLPSAGVGLLQLERDDSDIDRQAFFNPERSIEVRVLGSRSTVPILMPAYNVKTYRFHLVYNTTDGKKDIFSWQCDKDLVWTKHFVPSTKLYSILEYDREDLSTTAYSTTLTSKMHGIEKRYSVPNDAGDVELLYTREWRDGVPHGTWRQYSFGSVIQEETYVRGMTEPIYYYKPEELEHEMNQLEDTLLLLPEIKTEWFGVSEGVVFYVESLDIFLQLIQVGSSTKLLSAVLRNNFCIGKKILIRSSLYKSLQATLVTDEHNVISILKPTQANWQYLELRKNF